MYIRSYTMQDEQHKNFLVNFQHLDFGSRQSFQQKSNLMIWSGLLTLQRTACIRWWFYSWVVQKDLPSFGQSLVVVLPFWVLMKWWNLAPSWASFSFSNSVWWICSVLHIYIYNMNFVYLLQLLLMLRNPAPPGMYKTLWIMGTFTISTG